MQNCLGVEARTDLLIDTANKTFTILFQIVNVNFFFLFYQKSITNTRYGLSTDQYVCVSFSQSRVLSDDMAKDNSENI